MKYIPSFFPLGVALFLTLSPLKVHAVKTVHIIGGGPGSSTMAKMLAENGYEVTVFLNPGGWGGRLKTYTHENKGQRFIYDHGPLEVGGHQTEIVTYARTHGLHLEEIPPANTLPRFKQSLSEYTMEKYGATKTGWDLLKYGWLTSQYPLGDTHPAMGTHQFLKENNIESMEVLLGFMLSLHGYGQGYRETPHAPTALDGVPLAHTLQGVPSEFITLFLKAMIPGMGLFYERPAYTIAEGYGALYNKMYEESLIAGVCYRWGNISQVFDDPTDPSKIILKDTGGNTYASDAVISAALPGEMSGIEVQALSTKQREILSKITPNFYGSTIFELTGSHDTVLLHRQYANLEYKGYDPLLIYKKFNEHPVYISYNYTQGVGEEDYQRSTDALKATLLKHFVIKPGYINILSQSYGIHYPHSPNLEDIPEVNQTTQDLQGSMGGKFFASGAFTTFDSVDAIIRHGQRMVRTHFPPLNRNLERNKEEEIQK